MPRQIGLIAQTFKVRPLLIGLIALVSVGSPGTARAVNSCISAPEAGGSIKETLVGSKFRIPGPGLCVPFNGFAEDKHFDGDAYRYTGFLVSGNACTALDRSTVSFNLAFGGFGTGSFALTVPLNGGTGSGAVCGLTYSTGCVALAPTFVPCVTALGDKLAWPPPPGL